MKQESGFPTLQHRLTFSYYCCFYSPIYLLHGRCAAAGFSQDVQYEKIAMDWVMEYQPERYNVLMRRPPVAAWEVDW